MTTVFAQTASLEDKRQRLLRASRENPVRERRFSRSATASRHVAAVGATRRQHPAIATRLRYRPVTLQAARVDPASMSSSTRPSSCSPRPRLTPKHPARHVPTSSSVAHGQGSAGGTAKMLLVQALLASPLQFRRKLRHVLPVAQECKPWKPTWQPLHLVLKRSL
jgi:hypothetical protein